MPRLFTPVIDGTRGRALPYLSAKPATGLVPIKSTFCHTEIETAWTPHTEVARRIGCKIHFACKGKVVSAVSVHSRAWGCSFPGDCPLPRFTFGSGEQ